MIGWKHPLFSLLVQLALIGLTRNPWYGVAAASFYLGREHAQAEYRWIERYGFHKRSNMPLFGAFDLRVWDLHSVTDMVLPVLLTIATSFVYRLF